MTPGDNELEDADRVAHDPARELDSCAFFPNAGDPETLVAELDLETGSNALVRAAVQLASLAHAAHTRDEGDPYIVHPLRVALTLARTESDTPPEVLAAAVCHDVIEDAPRFTADVHDLGAETTRLVEALTSDFFDDGEYYNGIIAAGPRACLIKLADRSDNLRFLHRTDQYKQARYLRGTQRVYPRLVDAAGAPQMGSALWSLVNWHSERIAADLA